MKVIALVICLFLLCENVSSDTLACTGTPSKEEDCTSKEVDDGYYCCFWHIKYKSKFNDISEEKSCQLIDQKKFNAIGKGWSDAKKALKEEAKSAGNKLEKYEIKCQSTFLKIGFVCLFVILLS